MRRLPGEVAGPADTRVVPTGFDFDAIRVPRYLALPALARLRTPGAIIVDPCERALYFFTRPGTAASWDVPETRPLGATQYLIVPPVVRISPPGPYWLVSPGAQMVLAPVEELRAALDAAVTDALGPRPEPAP